jgi:phenylalanyl-tRNA synthetase alpha chain
LKENIELLKWQGLNEIDSAGDKETLGEIRVRYLGKKGKITKLLKTISMLPKCERPALGKEINELKQVLESAVKARSNELENAALEKKVKTDSIDITLPGIPMEVGALHPITKAFRDIAQIFYGMSFTIYESRESETDEMNFVKLNIAPGHPARDMQDTLYLSENTLLRTHTSPGQIRGMLELKGKLPVRFIVPGRVYRRDQTDASHSPVFHQIEGLAIDKDISFHHLRGVLLSFARGFFGNKVDIRLRPSYFPFTEPSAEVDVSCVFCNGKGCSTCGGEGWLEVAGAGMVHPKVIKNGGYDPQEVTGFAFGFGLDRLTMLRYGINDMRMLWRNDKRFLSQFKGL